MMVSFHSITPPIGMSATPPIVAAFPIPSTIRFHLLRSDLLIFHGLLSITEHHGIVRSSFPMTPPVLHVSMA